jgi:hypothetical protein
MAVDLPLPVIPPIRAWALSLSSRRNVTVLPRVFGPSIAALPSDTFGRKALKGMSPACNSLGQAISTHKCFPLKYTCGSPSNDHGTNGRRLA